MEPALPLPRLLLPLLVVTLAACSQAVPAPVETARAARAASVPGKTVAPAAPKITVHRDAYCGCCHLWVEHLRTAGFDVEDRVEDAMSPVKDRLGILPQHASCHTAEVDGYVIEGHVPAADIRRLLREKPPIRGLVLPGMPIGSPGMEMEGVDAPAYTVLALNRDGSTTPYAEHSP
ncbi:DUF411 domain-containing protein [Pseudoxanthomonas mexicana]|uniref:DUF411 domain-containing protein n=1 Tax=Pseudoxanthomonas mexicana TaxID=128785 RepID=A0ABX6RD29_PSEMX|nr:DUF411 domain-containing protein [Pseudoxanthomonas mexicana]QLQ29120.1 MAG: DUF411 domain-containing protein [Pseudoxanthomonas sp.]QND81077.1 DUF411 domain-containing protein [Pseudoxanthomonas mexicana]